MPALVGGEHRGIERPAPGGPPRRVVLRIHGALEMLVHVLDHHDGSIDHRPDRDRDAAERHDVGAHADPPHRDEGHQDAERQGQNGHQRRAGVQQEENANQGDDETLFEQLAAEVFDRPVNEIASVVHRCEHHPFRQSSLNLLDLRLDPPDRREGVLAESHDHDPANGVAPPVELRDSPPHGGTDAYPTEFGHPDRGPIRRCTHDNVLDVRERFEVAQPAHHVFALGQLDDHGADVGVRILDRCHHGGNRDAVAEQLGRVEIDLVLFLESAQRRNLGDTWHCRECIPEIPVLNAAQIRQTLPPSRVLECVLIHPPQAGRVWPEGGCHVRGKLAFDSAQVFEHA